MSNKIPGSASRLKIVDHTETYGRHILEKISKKYKISTCLDLGCGHGSDLLSIKKYNSNCKLVGVDFNLSNKNELDQKGIELIKMDIEKDRIPFSDNTFDFIILNQVLEHTKEIFWINHEIFRCLKKDGYLFLGVPNILSLHNRILMLLGFHPTCSKIISAHVRSFSNRDVKKFYNIIGKDFCKMQKKYGSQFYPFPKLIARFLSKIFPSFAVTSFYVIKKNGKYNDEFLQWPNYAKLETNYFTGLDVEK